MHYENINELLVESIEMINKKFIAQFESKSKDKLQSSDTIIFISPEYLIPYLNFIKENPKVFNLIHNKPDIFGAEKTFKKMYRTTFEPALQKFNLNKDEAIYIFEFYTNGTLSIILKWVERGCKESIEKITELILKLIPTPVKKTS